jgi:hypothetical protein
LFIAKVSTHQNSTSHSNNIAVVFFVGVVHSQGYSIVEQNSVITAYAPPPCSSMDHEEIVVPENARAVCGKELPPVNPEAAGGSILLFYQYVEDPIWTKAEHKAALKKVIEIGTKYNITGRGRVAREGLNCTLTGKPHDIRSFCYGLREWNDVFNDTDFKITDGVAADKMFKALSIRKTNELVAYGLAGGKCFCGGCG